MELWSSIGNLSPGVAVGVVCLYMYNSLTLKYLEERKEMIERIAAERREWIEASRLLAVQNYDLQRDTVEAMTAMRLEMHALRGKITEVFLGQGRSSGND